MMLSGNIWQGFDELSVAAGGAGQPAQLAASKTAAAQRLDSRVGDASSYSGNARQLFHQTI